MLIDAIPVAAGAAAPTNVSDGAQPCAAGDVTCAVAASAVDVDAVLARWLDEARAGRRTARSVSAVLERLRAAEHERAMKLGKKRIRRMNASSIFQGVVGIAAAALSAVAGGAGIAATSAAQGAAQGASQGVSAAVRKMRILQTASQVGSALIDKAGPQADPYSHQAERLALRREAAQARTATQEGLVQLTQEHIRAVEETVHRAVDILDRCQNASAAAGRIALTRSA
jgi:hypothetical protein